MAANAAGIGERRRGGPKGDARTRTSSSCPPRPPAARVGTGPRYARPTRRAPSPPTAARSSRARRRSGTHRVSPSRFSARAPCTGLARRRSGTCSSQPRGASCRSSRAERRASRWSTSPTWPGPSSALSKGVGEARRSSWRTRRSSSTAASPRRSRPFPRGVPGSCRSPPSRFGRRAPSPALFSTFGKGPPVFNAEKANELLQRAWICDVSDAQVALGQPFRTDFETGARLTWEWYLERGWISDRGGKIPVTGDTK